ncbi:tetratricopeptide repeat protein [Flavobacterium sp. 3HN19-14]|uniref:tetratricopeptide repeat protein n=1 Tax=Flavobacterium sp. 3HN19-14 TaxID=3448133 RepID=UPI003EE2396B
MKINTPVYFCCLAIFCLVHSVAFSQDWKAVDSLKNEIAKHEARMREFGAHADPMADTLKIRLLNMIVTQVYRDNPNKAMPYVQEELALSEKLHDDWGLSATANTLGNIYDYRGEYAKAIAYFKKALEVNQRTGKAAVR